MKLAIANRNSEIGFTLVELLVVVTIIVILLALLAPAMDQAIYQAELARCAGKLKSLGSAISLYAMENKRTYPDRGLPQQNQTTIDPHVTSLVWPSDDYDMRPPLRDFISINQHLQCPLIQPVELENTQIDEFVMTSYTMWWGWRYNTRANGAHPGMMKLGDQWGWLDDRFGLLAGDYDLWLGAGDTYPIQGSHPDHDDKMIPFAQKYKGLADVGVGPVQPLAFTLSLWARRQATDRGPIDMNHVYDDASVRRFNGVGSWWNSGERLDERMSLVPNGYTQNEPWKFYQVPRN